MQTAQAWKGPTEEELGIAIFWRFLSFPVYETLVPEGKKEGALPQARGQLLLCAAS